MSRPADRSSSVVTDDALLLVGDDGRVHRVPYAPTGADRLALERRTAAEDASRPLEDVLRELQVAAKQLLQLEVSRT